MQHNQLRTLCYFTIFYRGIKKGFTNYSTHKWASRAIETESEDASPSESYWLLPIITYADMANID